MTVLYRRNRFFSVIISQNRLVYGLIFGAESCIIGIVVSFFTTVFGVKKRKDGTDEIRELFSDME